MSAPTTLDGRPAANAAADPATVGAYAAPAPAPAPDNAPIRVKRWPAEEPLLVLSALAAASAWLVLTLSLIGIAYAAMLAAFFFVAHVGFVAHLRGNAVRVGPDQLPALHARVALLARRMGFAQTPEVYVLQAGGALNALATRFFRAQVVVLFSELLEACGDDEGARDMIIAHELGHLRAGHLKWHWLLLPSAFVPFLGSALSRAREYTADRYGLAGAGSRDAAVRGLTLLAAGPALARQVDRAAFVRQHRALDTGWMRLGEWMMSHPPLPRRIAQLEPALGPAPQGGGATVRAVGILAAVAFLPAAVGIGVAAASPRVRDAFRTAATSRADTSATAVEAAADTTAVTSADESATEADAPARRAAFDAAVVQADFARLAAVVEAERTAGRPVPWDGTALRAAWERARPGQPYPIDPADGAAYGYDWRGDAYRFTSSGPDGEAGTADDVRYDSRAAR